MKDFAFVAVLFLIFIGVLLTYVIYTQNIETAELNNNKISENKLAKAKKNTPKKNVKQNKAKKNIKKENTKKTKKKDKILKLNGGGHINFAKREIIFDGWICDRGGTPLEFFAVQNGGGDHEAIVSAKCRPDQLHLALLMLGAKPGKVVKYQGDTKRVPTGDKIIVYTEWKENGKKKRVRAEDMVYNRKAKRPMIRAGWVFAGSKLYYEMVNTVTGERKKLKKPVYAANVHSRRPLVATYFHPATVLDNPNKTGCEMIFFGNEKVVPAYGTKVKLIFYVPKKKEKKKEKKNEKDKK